MRGNLTGAFAFMMAATVCSSAAAESAMNIPKILLPPAPSGTGTGTGTQGQGDNLGNHLATKDLDMGGKRVLRLPTPVGGTDAANKAYVDSRVSSIAGDNLGNHFATKQINAGDYGVLTSLVTSSGHMKINAGPVHGLTIDAPSMLDLRTNNANIWLGGTAGDINIRSQNMLSILSKSISIRSDENININMPATKTMRIMNGTLLMSGGFIRMNTNEADSLSAVNMETLKKYQPRLKAGPGIRLIVNSAGETVVCLATTPVANCN